MSMDLFYDRRSVRQYTAEKIPDEDVKKIVTAGFYAPTAVNKQETEFIIIDDKKILEDIIAVHPYSAMLKNCSHAIAVIANVSKAYTPGYWVMDASAAAENILLAAHQLGYGGVWLGVYPEEDRMMNIAKILKLPQTHKILNVISLGVPAHEQKRPERFDNLRLHFNTFGKN
ncbi:NADPH nitroreductase, putative [Entamoeba invadens IP1]|uniref:NADPH nitroreductase, putative n=1 Tax=Entamoeba invadens IP1 TaxID=370355 RepID=A0A0A1TYZ3_ENTIV|nr:NADPH nitroreductase, putative [Entamoeba invadens IP1]ELP86729.1 NADPH nitroreductase, putative [Entamoeba invadens IP1]|eukprot:XP_004186075.1 NADPH nitroreductase, putative [Entamoeba invadens IP1]